MQENRRRKIIIRRIYENYKEIIIYTLLVAALGYAAFFGSAINTLLAPILIGATTNRSTNKEFRRGEIIKC